MAPDTFKVDYKSEGEWEAAANWANFDDSNTPIQLKPRVVVSQVSIWDDTDPETEEMLDKFKNQDMN